MKVIIAGGRKYILNNRDWQMLATLDITEVVSGYASGADRGGEAYATANNIPIKHFRAHREKYQRASGPIRNREMAQYADALVLFPGGRGTASMEQEAKKEGLKIYNAVFD